ncbi:MULTISPECIES: pyridoxal phosphate-dependent aminotransferase [Bacteroides]|uniref:aminotransferase class I/II-fold pyridoxal phosphate-dependent enzyme n=1 Tax=Bacteroides TaxID=816 RepID=UPI001F1AAEF2|nr:pyridoxal phosphate-dependent aminotransferase [Bacteroides nordii]MBD9111913.1 pyridoxal phosphate-dependent aminotransferase [Bacteroides nordii]MCE8464519.1 pyridoxal phosphate-dependent aminotransferase [Bacteroides nordii]UYU49883.1 pyridoxal phosphate-dependent aminotransferase [Bacteroides nordii]
MKDTPIKQHLIDETIEEFQIADFSKATIREVKAIAAKAEAESGIEFIKMEMGVPGLPPSAVGVKAEVEALQKGIASLYPDINGLPELKQEASRFIKAFINVDLKPEGCVPVTGSMQGTFASFLTCSQCDEKKDTILFIDPGFPVQKQQLVVMGQKYETFDVYDFRGEKLKEKLESYLQKGNISAIIYSNPNNPSWICLDDKELRIIGELATQYDVIVLEDLAYFAMDFRQNLSTPFQTPYQPSVAHYTDNYILLISGSKAFSYAGQRIGVSCISDKLYHRHYPGLTKRYGGGTFGTVFIHRVLYALSSGTSHSAQFAMAAMLKAANEGEYNFLDEVKIYGERAKKLKEIFLRHGFHLVYDKDLGEPIADGFYFTIGYPGMTSGELAKELMYYGVSAISLVTTGSHQEGLRACTSFIKDHQYEQLDERMKIFKENHPIS